MKQISLFDNEKQNNYDRKPNVEKGDLIIISISRRTDIYWHIGKIVELLKKYPPDIVHTIVIWTKFADTLFKEPLYSVLKQYKHIFVNLTITGLGGTFLEKNVISWEDNIKLLPKLIDFIGSPERIRLRIDPIVDLSFDLKDEYKAKTVRNSKVENIFTVNGDEVQVTNKEIVKLIAKKCIDLGIKNFVTSYLVPYGKVKNKIANNRLKFNYMTEQEKHLYFDSLRKYINELGGELYACSISGFPRTACIDGELLSSLHPEKLPCSVFKPHTREDCNCTHSIEVVWYDNNFICKSGCIYCYANTI